MRAVNWHEAIGDHLDETRRLGRWREVHSLGGGDAHTTLADGTPVTVFASNDYLGLSQHPAVRAAAIGAIEQFGTGAGSARLIVGSRPIHDDLERSLARWKGTEAAVVFPTGFAANLGILTALAAVGDTEIFSDELNHASIIDGARLSRAPIRVFGHRDVAELDRMLHESTAARSIVVSDAVFSMDGDAAPIDELFAVCRAHGALLVLDEAHSVLAAPLPDHGDLELVIVGTLSKTLGALGGFVAGSRCVVDLCINAARSFIFTTAPTPGDCAAALRALEILQSDEGSALKARLRANAEIVRAGHDSPIIPVIVGSEQRAVEAAAALLERRLLVPAIRPPTVAPGTCRLRVAMSAAHDPDDALRLRDALDDLGLS